jgi:hypothetical protein
VPKVVFITVALLIVQALAFRTEQVAAVELICDGGFESGSVDVVGTPAKIASCEWNAVNRGGGVLTGLSTLSHSGTYSARVDTIGATDGGYFYQDFAQVSSCFILRTWVRRSAEDSVIRLMADWDRGSGGANTPVASVFLDTGTFRLNAWSGPLVAGTIAVSGSEWFEVTLLAAGDYSVQGLLINGQLSVTDLGTTVTAPETILLGDPSTSSSSNGNYRFDDVSIDSGACPRDSDVDGVVDGSELVGTASAKKALGTFITNPLDPDSDDDGCLDGQELSANEMAGGLRDPTNPHDYFNPTGDGLNRIDDVLMVIGQYFEDEFLDPPANTIANPQYNPDTDRSALGPNQWNLGPPNGEQRIDDVLAIIYQYFHDCA